jgi:hypothetical protein
MNRRRPNHQPATVLVITLQPRPGIDDVRSLRWVLKTLLRRHGIKCIAARRTEPHERKSRDSSRLRLGD